MLQTIRNWFRQSKTRRPYTRPEKRFRLAAEILEDRTVPATIDVTGPLAVGTSTDGNVIVSHVDLNPTGTGLIDPFVRIHHQNSEEGYNTDFRGSPPSEDLLDALTDPNFTNAIKLGDVREVTIDSVNYREFRLDLGEPGNATSESGLINFSKLQFFYSTSNLEHGYSAAGPTLGATTLIYDLETSDVGGDDFTLRDLTAGNGAMDYVVYVKSSLFTTAGATNASYLYLYSAFGSPAPTADGTFEEWSAQKPGDEGPEETVLLEGTKYYDSNADGAKTGETGIPDWEIYFDNDSDPTNGVVAIAYTNASGHYAFTTNPALNYDTDGDASTVCLSGLTADITYYIYEGAPIETDWLQTGGVGGYTIQLLSTGALVGGFPKDAEGASVAPNALDFGNLCLGEGGGLTLGFWSSRNGKAILAANDPAWRNLLNSLHLRDASGNDFDISLVASFTDAYTSFRTWLLNATATNMAYMLSAQLAAMQLNVAYGSVSGSALVYAPGCGNTGVGNNFITIADLIVAADAQLAANPVTTAEADPTSRSIQECLKDALDDANNNLNFVQAGFEDCPYTFVTPDLL